MKKEYDMRMLDASAFVRMLAEDIPANSGDTASLVARRALEFHGFGAAAEAIIEILDAEPSDQVVICGFRTVEELLVLSTALPHTEVLWVRAPERVRFARSIERGRIGQPLSLEEFRRTDSEQAEFGLLRVASDVADYVIDNDGSLDDLVSALRRIAQAAPGRRRFGAEPPELFRVLSAIRDGNGNRTPAEIARLARSRKAPMRSTNVSRALREHADMVLSDDADGRARYSASPRGTAYLELVERKLGLREALPPAPSTLAVAPS